MVIIPMINNDQQDQALQVQLQHFQWNCMVKPETKATLFMDKDGLHISFTVQEKSPLITALKQTEPMPMVCQDSAVEVFLAFADQEDEQNFKPALEHCMYTNIEINAAGICYAKYGYSRKNRTAFTFEQIQSLNIQINKTSEYWTCSLIVPRDLVKLIAKYDAFAKVFAFNLYKISETPAVEHYVSFSPINSEKPNFHLPEFFALAQCQQ